MRAWLRRILPIVAAALIATAPGALWAQSGSASPSPEPRIALVIGNGAYKEQALRNPPSDARAVSASLRKLGFTVIERIDAGRRGMEEAVLEFGEKLKEGGVGLFYYAGHGMQVRGVNYLIPVDAAITSEASVRVQALDVGLVLDLMSDARNRANVVILDSCRNNPFAAASRGTKGLAAIDAARGTLIAYATAPGAVAMDGDGDNSPYTAALVKTFDEPGLKVEELFKRVRTTVVDRTQGLQTPWESSSLTGELVFNITVTVKPPPPQTAVPPPARDPADTVFWSSIQASNNPRDFHEYLRQFPNGTFAGLARRRVDELHRNATKLPTEKALAETVDPAKRSASAEALTARVYSDLMNYILPRSRIGGDGPNKDQPFLYREAKREKAMAICLDWRQYVGQTYGKAAAAEGAGIHGWRASTTRPVLASAREEALALCWMLYGTKGCSCEVFDENDQSALKLPDPVRSALLAPARAEGPAAGPPAAAGSPPTASRPQIATAPAAAGATGRLATLRDLTDRTYDEISGHVLPRTKFAEGPDKGKPYDYRGRPQPKAFAACVDWRAHENIYRSRQSPAGEVGSVLAWHMSGGVEPTLEAARARTLARCTGNAQGKTCTCAMVDENDRNVLELPMDYARRWLANPEAQLAAEEARRKQAREAAVTQAAAPPATATPTPAAPARRVFKDAAELRRAVYDRLMSTALAQTLGSGMGVGATQAGKPNDYRDLAGGKALAACTDWSARSVEALSLLSWGRAWNVERPLMSSIRESAIEACSRNAKPGCTCQVIDENDKNVIEMPAEFSLRLMAPRS